MLKENLDNRICDFEEGANNTQTLREFIQESEKEFDMMSKDLDSMSENDLQGYLDFLDYLWTK